LEILLDNLLNKKVIISKNGEGVETFNCTAKILSLLNSLSNISEDIKKHPP